MNGATTLGADSDGGLKKVDTAGNHVIVAAMGSSHSPCDSGAWPCPYAAGPLVTLCLFCPSPPRGPTYLDARPSAAPLGHEVNLTPRN